MKTLKCKACGHHNNTGGLTCRNCDAELLDQPVTHPIPAVNCPSTNPQEYREPHPIVTIDSLRRALAALPADQGGPVLCNGKMVYAIELKPGPGNGQPLVLNLKSYILD